MKDPTMQQPSAAEKTEKPMSALQMVRWSIGILGAFSVLFWGLSLINPGQ